MPKRPAMFWSGETLSERLKVLIDPFVPERVDCAAYTLAIGPEIYVSPNDQAADPTTVTAAARATGRMILQLCRLVKTLWRSTKCSCAAKRSFNASVDLSYTHHRVGAARPHGRLDLLVRCRRSGHSKDERRGAFSSSRLAGIEGDLPLRRIHRGCAPTTNFQPVWHA